MRLGLTIIVFGVGVACGGVLTSRLASPDAALAHEPTVAANDLESRVAALEGKMSRLQGSVVVSSTGAVTIKGPRLDVTSSYMDVRASTAKFANVIEGKTLIVSSVVSASYTPGAGNIW